MANQEEQYNHRIEADIYTNTFDNLSVSEQPYKPQVLSPERLSHELQGSCQYLLDYMADDYGFVSPNHPLVQFLQEKADEMGDVNAPYTRVLVLKNSSLNAMAMPDGTLIINSGLLNRLKYIELLATPLLHEQPHFERNHHNQEPTFWYGYGGSNSFLNRAQAIFGRTGIRRFQEYEADFLTAFKAEKIGMDTLAFNSLLRLLATEDDKLLASNMFDPDHGNPLERELNLIMAHSIFDFESSSEKTRTPVPKEWKIPTPTSKMDNLNRANTKEEWSYLFEQATPLIRQAYLCFSLSEINSMYGKILDYKYKRTNEKNISLADLETYINDVLQRFGWICESLDTTLRAYGYGNTYENLRLAKYIVLVKAGLNAVNISPDFFIKIIHDTHSFFYGEIPDSVRGFLTYRISDSELQMLEKIENIADEGKIFEDCRLRKNEQKDADIQSRFFASFSNLHLAEEIQEHGFTVDQTIITVETAVEAYRFYKENIGEEEARRWLLVATRNILEEYIYARKSVTFQENVIREVFEIIERIQKKERVFTIVDFDAFSSLSGMLLLGEKYGRSPETSRLENKLKRLFINENEELANAFNRVDFFEYQSYISSDPEQFVRDLAALQLAGRINEAVNSIVWQLVDNIHELPGNFIPQPIYRDGHLRKFLGISNKTKWNFQEYLQEQPAEEVSIYRNLAFIIEILSIITIDQNFEEKLDLTNALFSDSVWVEYLNKLPDLMVMELCSRWLIEVNPDIASSAYPYSVSEKYKLKRHPYLMEDELSEDESNGTIVLETALFSYYAERMKILFDSAVEPQELVRIQQAVRRFIAEYIYGGISQYNNTIAKEAALEKIKPFESGIHRYFSEFDFFGAEPLEKISYYHLILESGVLKNKDLPLVTKVQEIIITDQELSLSQAIDFIEVESLAARLSFSSLKIFIEKRIHTYQDYLTIYQKIPTILDRLMSEGAVTTGMYSITEQLSDSFLERTNVLDLFKGMLKTRESDLDLRKAFVQPYWEIFIDYNRGINGCRVQIVNGRAEITGGSAAGFLSFNDFIEQFFSLNEVEKMAILRKLFLSKNGLLIKPEYRAALTEVLFERIEEDDLLAPLIKKVIAASLEAADPVTLFSAISNVVLPLILQSPGKPASNVEVAQVLKENFIEFAHVPGRKGRSRVLGTDTHWVNKYGHWSESNLQKVLDLSKDEQLNSFMERSLAGRKLEQEYTKLIDNLQFITREKKALPTKNIDKYTAVSLVKGAAQPIAPLGPGFLQIIGQFVEYKDGYEELLDVYDNNEGQTKFSIFFMLEKLAQTDTSIYSLLYDRNLRLGRKLGAGKIATTHECWFLDDNGNEVHAALKTMNPNAERFLVETTLQAANVVDRLILNDPHSKSSYELARRALDIVFDWTLAEIQDTSYTELGDIFQTHHQGRKLNYGYSMSLTDRVGPQHQKVRVNSFAEGETLGRFLNNADRRQAQQVALAHADAVIAALIDPVDDSEVVITHRDPSIGNAIVSPNRELVFIDEQYSVWGGEERDFLETLISGPYTLKTLDSIFSYFLNLKENSHLDPESSTIKHAKESIIKVIVQETVFGYAQKIKNMLTNKEQKTNSLKLFNLIVQEFDKANIRIPWEIRIFFLKTVGQINKNFSQLGVPETFDSYYKKKKLNNG